MGSTAFWHVVHHCTSSKGIDLFTNESATHMNHPNIDHMNRWTQWWRVAFVLSAWFWFWSWRLSRENFGTWEGWRQHHLAFPFPQGRIMSPSHLPEHHPSQGICSMCIQCIQFQQTAQFWWGTSGGKQQWHIVLIVGLTVADSNPDTIMDVQRLTLASFHRLWTQFWTKSTSSTLPNGKWQCTTSEPWFCFRCCWCETEISSYFIAKLQQNTSDLLKFKQFVTSIVQQKCANACLLRYVMTHQAILCLGAIAWPHRRISVDDQTISGRHGRGKFFGIISLVASIGPWETKLENTWWRRWSCQNPTESNRIQPNPTLQFWSFINFLGSLLFDVGISLKVKLVHDATSPGGVLVPRIQRHEGLQLALARLQCWQWICKIDSLPDSLPDSVDA